VDVLPEQPFQKFGHGRTQFNEWPNPSAGFCKVDGLFQNGERLIIPPLLMIHHGQQRHNVNRMTGIVIVLIQLQKFPKLYFGFLEALVRSFSKKCPAMGDSGNFQPPDHVLERRRRRTSLKPNDR
jgi:hypothetical protein